MKQVLEIWHKIDEWVQIGERTLIVLSLAVLMFAGMLNIVLRLTGFSEIVFTSILLKQLTLWLGLLGAAIATASSEHLNVDAFGRLLKNRGLQVNNVVIGVLCVLFSGYFTYLAVQFFFFQSKQLKTAHIGGGSFAWIWVVVFPLAFAMMTLRYFFQTIEHGGVLFSPDVPDVASGHAEEEAAEAAQGEDAQ
jgi:TRAP-type C4-dicarboxylate transport system permease small subunit